VQFIPFLRLNIDSSDELFDHMLAENHPLEAELFPRGRRLLTFLKRVGRFACIRECGMNKSNLPELAQQAAQNILE
jgi:hypothetical protein